MRIGVYVCECGINIGATVDVEKVADYASTLPHVAVSRHYKYMCSDPGQELIKKDIKELNLDRVVVTSCSPRMHEPTFRNVLEEMGLNPYCFEMVNIREQCSWVHSDKEKATEKAKSLIAGAVSRATFLEPLEKKEVDVIPNALVIGGGIAGIQAALEIADKGYKTYLVEKTRPVKNFDEACEILRDRKDKFDPNREAVVELGTGSQPEKLASGNAALVSCRTREVVIETQSEGRSFLVLSDSFYPGWKAYIDGIETKIYKTNGIARGVFVDPGVHMIKFVYSPLSFRTGVNS